MANSKHSFRLKNALNVNYFSLAMFIHFHPFSRANCYFNRGYRRSKSCLAALRKRCRAAWTSNSWKWHENIGGISIMDMEISWNHIILIWKYPSWKYHIMGIWIFYGYFMYLMDMLGIFMIHFWWEFNEISWEYDGNIMDNIMEQKILQRSGFHGLNHGNSTSGGHEWIHHRMICFPHFWWQLTLYVLVLKLANSVGWEPTCQCSL